MTREEAIKILKARPYSGEVLEALETLVPEYKESEDERIRKWLYEYISNCPNNNFSFYGGVGKDAVLNYLKKQKEKNDGFIEGLEQGKKQFYWKPTEEDIRLFNKAVTTNTSLSPQERAQLDIVRLKFKHCPYIEQKRPTEWSKEDDKILKGIIGLIDHNQHYDVSNKDMLAWLKSLPQRFNLQSKQEQNEYITPHKEFFKFIYDRLINVHKENPNVDYMRSFKERLNNLSFGEKQEWSKEDEKTLDCIINVLDRLGFEEYWKSSRDQDVEEERFYYKEIQCLKKLKSLCPQSKQEWNKEDEKMLQSIIKDFRAGKVSTIGQEQWLKSLHPQSHKEIYQATKHDLAIKFMNYLDENKPEGKMSLSNAECEDIDKAFKENDWNKIFRYIEKYGRRN